MRDPDKNQHREAIPYSMLNGEREFTQSECEGLILIFLILLKADLIYNVQFAEL